MSLTLVSGDRVSGVPEPPPESDGDAQLDDTGYVDAVTVDGTAVRLSEVTEASIERPSPA